MKFEETCELMLPTLPLHVTSLCNKVKVETALLGRLCH